MKFGSAWQIPRFEQGERMMHADGKDGIAEQKLEADLNLPVKLEHGNLGPSYMTDG